MARKQPSKRANIFVARVVPCIVVGMIGYVAWVVTKPLCVDYLLRPQSEIYTRPRPVPAIVILVIFYVLLFLMVLCYFRLGYVVNRNPGFVPRGPRWHTGNVRKNKTEGNNEAVDAGEASSSQTTAESISPSQLEKGAIDEKQYPVEDFWQRDIFACQFDGRPPFCSHCRNWKPDRAHHCSDLNRCVRRMDHFCPWVGGIVAETSFKFFVQFTFYGALCCLHVLVFTGYFFAQRRHVFGEVNVHWAVALGIVSLFFLFAAAMSSSSLQLAFTNQTTVESLNGKRKTYFLAIHIPNYQLAQLRQAGSNELRLITYPRPMSERMEIMNGGHTSRPGATIQDGSNPHYGAFAEDVPPPPELLRTFAILETPRGGNPWHLGARNNFEDLMGYRVWDWLLPVRQSPFVTERSSESLYKFGLELDGMKYDAGLVENAHSGGPQTTAET